MNVSLWKSACVILWSVWRCRSISARLFSLARLTNISWKMSINDQHFCSACWSMMFICPEMKDNHVLHFFSPLCKFCLGSAGLSLPVRHHQACCVLYQHNPRAVFWFRGETNILSIPHSCKWTGSKFPPVLTSFCTPPNFCCHWHQNPCCFDQFCSKFAANGSKNLHERGMLSFLKNVCQWPTFLLYVFVTDAHLPRNEGQACAALLLTSMHVLPGKYGSVFACCVLTGHAVFFIDNNPVAVFGAAGDQDFLKNVCQWPTFLGKCLSMTNISLKMSVNDQHFLKNVYQRPTFLEKCLSITNTLAGNVG